MAFANRGKMLLGHPVAHARRGSTVAGTCLIARQGVTVVVGQLFAGVDAAPGINPNATAHHYRLAVGDTAVIEKPGRIPHHAAVNIIVLIEGKEVRIVPLQVFLPLRFGEFRANILDDPLPLSQVHPGKAAMPWMREG